MNDGKRFAVIYRIEDMEKNAAARPKHIEFLESLRGAGRIETAWKFPDYDNGLIQGVVICRAEDKAEVATWFDADPAVSSGARSYEVRVAEQGIFAK